VKALILGAGIAGASTAIALAMQGIQVEIYERHTAPASIGAGVVLWSNGAFVLDQLGLLSRIAGVAGRPVAMKRLSHSGENLGAIDIERINSVLGYPSYSILRRDLHHILLQALAELGVPVHFGRPAQRITSANGAAVVQFSDGLELTADLIVGAEGRMHSVTRTYVSGDNRPIHQGFANWLGVVKTERPLFKDGHILDVWGVGQRFGMVPVGPTTAYWAGAIAQPTEVRINGEAPAQSLLKHFASWPDWIAALIQATPAETIRRIEVYDHDPLEHWHRGHVIVLGDAAHAALPTSGQGACQALEDAWHLARSVARQPADLAQALATFTQTRRAKTTWITTGARQLAQSLFSQDPEYCARRNTASKRTDYQALARQMGEGWAENLRGGAQFSLNPES
jgi:FAD-dependent urate hydroxylase